MKHLSIIFIVILFFSIHCMVGAINVSERVSAKQTNQVSSTKLHSEQFVLFNSILLFVLIIAFFIVTGKLYKSNQRYKKKSVEKDVNHNKMIQLTEDLQNSVNDKSVQLQKANELLKKEIEQRKKTEIKLENSYEEMKRILEDTVNALISAVEKRDLYTAGHQKRVAKLSLAIGNELGFSADKLEGLQIAAQLHDIGKISIPSEILSKPGKISPAEYELIKTHVQAGYDILEGIQFPWPIAEIVLQHHEKYDGSGYPQGLKGDEICTEAKILCMANVVVAMTTHRPHMIQATIEDALKELESLKGKDYDPDIVDICLHLFREKGFTL